MTIHHHRRSIRLKDYDYTQNGAYFVTICAHERQYVFGDVMHGYMALNEWGRIVQSCWDDIPAHYPMVELDAFVVMPNHIHGVIVIANGDVGAQYIAPLQNPSPQNPSPQNPSPQNPSPQNPFQQNPFQQNPSPQNAPKRGVTPNNVTPNSLGSIVRTFKAAAARLINRLPNPPDHPIWQRNYHEHIIRNTESLNQIRAYVAINPTRWAEDSLFANRGFNHG